MIGTPPQASGKKKSRQLLLLVWEKLPAVSTNIIRITTMNMSPHINCNTIYTVMDCLEAISEQLTVYRQTNNLMLLSHNSFLLREIISDREAPFLFEKLGSYYHHILIDEFQDTSTYQWEKPQAIDYQYSWIIETTFLLVGDVKQSILPMERVAISICYFSRQNKT